MRSSVFVILGAAAVSAGIAHGSMVSVKLTTNALGLGSSDLNAGNIVDPDIPGKFVTSGVTGEGSILWVQRSGLAGMGTGSDPLLVTITARTHLDTISGLPALHDYQAGVIYLSNESTALPDGRDEGLGVRAFKVVGATGRRELDSGTGRARIEGSKEVSGGTGPTSYNASNPNGAPHVDEEALFLFPQVSHVFANSIKVTLSKFEASDRIHLTVNLLGGGVYSNTFLGPPNAAFSNPGDAVWNLTFADLGVFSATDVVTSFSIRAVDDNPSNPSGTAEHFLITGFMAEIVPTPGAAMVFAMLGATAFRRRRPA